MFVISAARYVIPFVAGGLVVRYLLHTSSYRISLHNKIVLMWFFMNICQIELMEKIRIQ